MCARKKSQEVYARSADLDANDSVLREDEGGAQLAQSSVLLLLTDVPDGDVEV